MLVLKRNWFSFVNGSRFLSTISSLENIKVVDEGKGVVHVQLNRPERRNALNWGLWNDIRTTFDFLDQHSYCRIIVLSGNGQSFCAGIDLRDGLTKISAVTLDNDKDVSRKAFSLRNMIKSAQDSFTSIEKCRKPVIAAIHSHCVGGAISLVSACDIRYAENRAIFSIKEVDVGLAADVGILNRIQKQTGNDSWARELAFTARNFQGQEALEKGFVSRTFDSREDCLTAALALAKEIASKSPVSVQGSKLALNYSRDHSVDESLEWLRNWNSAHLQTEDLLMIAKAMMKKSKPEFNDA